MIPRLAFLLVGDSWLLFWEAPLSQLIHVTWIAVTVGGEEALR